MSLGTYDGLLAAIGDWLNRSDLAAVIPTFIALAEADFNRTVRTKDMVQRASATINSQFTALPTDFLEERYFQINDTTPYRLQFITAQEMQDKRYLEGDVADKPLYYTKVGLTMEVFPTPDADYAAEIAYLQQITALGSGNQTNWLLLLHPDLYLYSSLLHSAPYLRDDDRVPLWQAAHDLAMAGIMQQEDHYRYTEGPLRVSMRAIG